MSKWNDIRLLLLVLMAFVLDFVKYIVLRTDVNSTFIMVEFLSWFLLFCFFFLLQGKLNALSATERRIENEIDRLKLSFQKERDELLGRINEYEKSVINAAQWDLDRTQVVEELRKIGETRTDVAYDKVLSILGSYFEIISGIFYKLDGTSSLFNPVGTYAYNTSRPIPSIEPGIGLGGQVVVSNEISVIDSVPNDYLVVSSGLGEARPCFLYLLPVSKNGIVIGLIELASFRNILIAPVWSELNGEIGIILAKD